MVFLVSPLVQHLGTHIVWTGPRPAGLRAARRHRRGARSRSLPGSPSGRRRARVRGVRAAARPRPADPGRQASHAAPFSPSGSPHDSCRRSSATSAAWSKRYAGAGWRFAVSGRARGCSRRSSPTLSSAGSTSPRRWRREATAARGERAHRATVDAPRPRGARRRAGPRRAGSPVALARVRAVCFTYPDGDAPR